MFVVVLGGIAWQFYLNVGFDVFSSGCGKGHDEAHVSLPEKLYGPFMTLRFHPPTPRAVSLVTISDSVEPLRIMTNACDGRKFLSDLVPQLALLRPRVIVIDKYYSEGACTDPDVNTAFRLALNGPSVPPVVAGQLAVIDSSAAGCLCLKPAFQFAPPTGPDGTGPPAPTSNVHLGLTQLNSDIRKIPLQWWAHDVPGNNGKAASSDRPVNGLAYVAVQQSDPDVASSADLQWFTANEEHPFGSFPKSFKTSSAMNVLCQSVTGAQLVEQHQWGDCAQVPRTQLYVTGKVVVIGELVDSDLHPFGGGDIYGPQLQASYINSLLEGQYVRSVSFGLQLVMILLAALVTAVWDIELYNGFLGLSKITTWVIDFLLLLVLMLINVALFEVGYFAPLFLFASAGILLGLLVRIIDIAKEKLATDGPKAHRRECSS